MYNNKKGNSKVQRITSKENEFIKHIKKLKDKKYRERKCHDFDSRYRYCDFKG